jgi:hypothetical protein
MWPCKALWLCKIDFRRPVKDFEEYSMRRLLMNGIYWALGIEVPQGGVMAEPKCELAGWEAPNTN